MNKQELISKIDNLRSLENSGVVIYFVLQKQGAFVLKKANVRHAALAQIKGSVEDNIDRLRSQLDDEDFVVKNLSEADDRQKAVYQYDLNEHPAPVQMMDELRENLFNDDYFTVENDRVFNFDNDNFGEIDGYIVSYGVGPENIIIYRKTYPVNLMKQGRGVFLLKDDEQIDVLKDDIFRIDGKIDFFGIEQDSFILNVTILEKYNDFKDIVIRSATNSIQQIANLDMVANMDQLSARANADMSFARKLIKVTTNSPILNVVAKEDIFAFARRHAYLSQKLKITNDHFELEKKTAQNIFLQLLDDAFLHSELSRNEYISPAKDRL